MDLETFLVALYCLCDDALKNVLHGARLRQRGPRPRLHDSEVIAMEVAGEYLGLETDCEIYRYFRRHWPRLYPPLKTVHRTTFLRQAANLRKAKEALWRHLVQRVRHDPALSILDSLPVVSPSLRTSTPLSPLPPASRATVRTPPSPVPCSASALTCA